MDALAECAAQLLGAARLTRQQGYEVPAVYGCTTTGTEWQFLKLEGNLCTVHPERYYTPHLPALLGALHYIIRTTRPAA